MTKKKDKYSDKDQSNTKIKTDHAKLKTNKMTKQRQIRDQEHFQDQDQTLFMTKIKTEI